MSHRRLMGWEASRTVTVERDAGGLVVGYRVDTEPEWTEWERHLALASADLEAATGPHGHPSWDATDPQVEDPDGGFHFAVGEPVVDYAARAQARAERAWREKHPDDDMAGLFFPVRKVHAREQ